VQESGYNRRTLQALAAAGKIPGATKPAGLWVFDVVKFREWIKAGEPTQCRTIETFSSARGYGGISEKSTASEYDEAYERALL
jgi:hypothetical protein